jgi:excinuclease ABC subunit A
MNRTILRNARTHNLRSVSLDLEPGQLVAVTGVSGSGKSSLCLDTLYAEGQRRFVESFSPYARQFLERHERPPIDSLDPVPAAVAVDRHAPVKSSRSTVATMADVEPYLSALFLREARPVCPTCRVPATWADAGVAAGTVAKELDGQRAIVLSPRRVEGTAAYLDARDRLLAAGLRRLWVADSVRDIDTVKPSEILAEGSRVDVVIDRISVRDSARGRLQEALEQAWGLTDGLAAVVVDGANGASRKSFRRGLVCPSCARGFEPPRSGLFSYQSPVGACETCKGFGRVIGIDFGKVFPDPSKTLAKGAIRPWSGKSSTWERRTLKKFCARHDIDMTKPWGSLSPSEQQAVIHGDGTWSGGKYPGVIRWFKYLESKAYKMHVRVLLSRYRAYDECPACQGKRLNPTALSYCVGDLDLAAWHALELKDAWDRLSSLQVGNGQGELVRKELVSRLGFLCDVGLGYLTLDRQARTLSGGEAQRVSLTAALGASLSGALVVLDEPTVGLHPSDIPPLVSSMRSLADRGNTVVVVEHDALVIHATDRVLELGPGAGALGGNLLFDGTPMELSRREDLPTGRALSSKRAQVPPMRRSASGRLKVMGAQANNLRDLEVELPLGVICALSGPSGSGKSTLAEDIVYRALARGFGILDVDPPGAHSSIEGADQLTGVVLVDQAPLGRTSRGNPATYTKAWDRIRALFAAEPAAKHLGFTASHFSFNVAAGRCDACSGEGFETVEMQFLADVSLLCPVCRGKRFKEEVLGVQHLGKTVADVLEMTVDEVLPWAAQDPAIGRALRPLQQLGLGYLPLGQPLSTLSGGEAQRLKLARALRAKVDRQLFILDEPSAGLHPSDVQRVIEAMANLVDRGASVLVVDHDLDILRASDWMVDLGPGAGRHGGTLVDQGTPETIQQGNHRTAKSLRGEYDPKPIPAKKKAVRAKPPVIAVSNAREHNLRDVSCEIPRDALVVVTGPSGSGKSSLVFDVIFAEGQRRFLETLTPYARQFLPTLPRPDVDGVQGLPPSIALEQRRSRTGGNSTVATVTEVAHYLRLLYAKVGTPHCPECEVPISVLTMDGLMERIRRSKGKGQVFAPVVQSRKGVYLDLFTSAHRAGIWEARVDGERVSTDTPPALRKTKEHDIDLLLWEGKLSDVPREAVETAVSWARGAVRMVGARGDEQVLSTHRACPSCGKGIPEMDPRWFSFNTQQGRCEVCEGTGLAWAGSTEPCEACEGSRLAPMPRAVRVHGRRYHEVVGQSVEGALKELHTWRFSGTQALIADPAIRELSRRIEFLAEVGLGYLGLDRDASTLSGGEMQRLRLSAQLGAGLTGALYVLDEPTIGLHPSDTSRLLKNLQALVATGSTVVVVEHDADTIRAADHLIDLGPGGGRQGGRIVSQGKAAKVLKDPASPTGQALARHEILEAEDRGEASAFITVRGARAHNLKGIDVRFPVGRLTVVAGVSGSGKSTLVQKILYPAVRQALRLTTEEPLDHDGVDGATQVERAAAVDQQPIGRTPRSVPATFLGVWDDLRKLFAALPESQVRGFKATRYSFNTNGGGRCSVCNGMGVLSHEMSFLPDVITPCDACHGSRFEPSTLEVAYRGMSMGDVLRMTANEAAGFFSSHPRIAAPLRTLADLGVGYVQLGQGSHTLSGGEAQRLKLALELTATVRHRPTLYVLDEPTTGLHVSDVVKLVRVLHQLVDRGDTLVVIEHHPDVIASADHVIELGPGGGEGGGRVVAEGKPRAVARKGTATGKVLGSLFLGGGETFPLQAGGARPR